MRWKPMGSTCQQEAAHELLRIQVQNLAPRFVTVILPHKRDLAVRELDQAVVRDRHPVGVAPEIVQHPLRPTEGRLGVDDPFGIGNRRQVAGEGIGIL